MRGIVMSILIALGVAGCGPGGGPYHKKDGAWFFEKAELRIPRGETLTVLNNRFARTRSVVFYRDSPIAGADAASFEALSEHYARDRGAAYYADTFRKGQEYFSIVHNRIVQLSGADVASFRLLGSNDPAAARGYAADNDQVWFEGRAMAGVDAASFRPLRGLFAQDARTVFYDLEPMPGADPASFEALDDNWSRDAHAVFWADIDLASQPAGARVTRAAEAPTPRPSGRWRAATARTRRTSGSRAGRSRTPTRRASWSRPAMIRPTPMTRPGASARAGASAADPVRRAAWSSGEPRSGPCACRPGRRCRPSSRASPGTCRRW
jgi:hypothetical protein